MFHVTYECLILRDTKSLHSDTKQQRNFCDCIKAKQKLLILKPYNHQDMQKK